MRRSCCLLYQLATIEDTCGNFQTSVAISSDSARNWQVLRRGREITWIRKDSIQRRDNRELPCISVSSKTLISIPQGSQKFKTGSLSRLTGACKAQTVAPCYSQSSGTGHPQSGASAVAVRAWGFPRPYQYAESFSSVFRRRFATLNDTGFRV